MSPHGLEHRRSLLRVLQDMKTVIAIRHIDVVVVHGDGPRIPRIIERLFLW